MTTVRVNILTISISNPWNGRVTGHGSTAAVGSHSWEARDLSDARNEGCLHGVPKPYCGLDVMCEQLVVTASRQGRGGAHFLDGTSLIQS